MASVVGNIVFGFRREYDDPHFLRVMEALNLTMKVCGSSGLLTIFPVLKYLPGDPFLLHHAQRDNEMNRVQHRQDIDFLRQVYPSNLLQIVLLNEKFN